MAKAFYSDVVKHYMRRWLLYVDGNGERLSDEQIRTELTARTPAGKPIRLQPLHSEAFTACTTAFKRLEPDDRAKIVYVYSHPAGLVPAVKQVAADEDIPTSAVWATLARFERSVAKLANLV